MENHNRRGKGLRAPSINLRKKFNLTPEDGLCMSCRLICAKQVAEGDMDAREEISYRTDDSVAGSSKDASPIINNPYEVDIDPDDRIPVERCHMELTEDFLRLSQYSEDPELPELLTQASKLSQLSIQTEISGITETGLTQVSKSSELSIRTLLPTINDGLMRMEQSPISEKKLSKLPWLTKKVDKICCNLKRLLGIEESVEQNAEINDPDLREIIDRLKTKFHSEETTRAQKIQILTILPSGWSVTKISRIMNATKHMVKKAKEVSKTKGILVMPDVKLGKGTPESIVTVVRHFYNDDCVSINMPGMKDYISCRNSENQRIHVQKRLILSNLRELFAFFREEHPSIAIGFSSFAALRPQHCVLAGSGGTHTVCVCAIHQNVKLMMLGANFEQLTAISKRPLNHYNDCIKLMICAEPSSMCHLGECQSCPGTSVLENSLRLALEEANTETIVYKNRIFSPRAKTETLTQTASEFIDDFCEKMKQLAPHTFISKQQSTFIK